MNFDSYESHWRETVPPLTLLETSWQLKSRKGRMLTCGIFQTVIGLEVRAGFGEDDLIRSQYVGEITAASQPAQVRASARVDDPVRVTVAGSR
jgi:hypothetical protein